MDLFIDDLRLDPCKTSSLREQLLFALRNRILDGRFHSGAQMPSTRILAQLLGVSRNTVVHVYETLLADGMIGSNRGSGTYVLQRVVSQAAASAEFSLKLSGRARELLSNGTDWSPSHPERVFEPGIPALDLFPHDRWRRCLSAAMSTLGPAALRSNDPRGSATLRSMIAAHIGPSRSVACTAEQVILFSSQRLAIRTLMATLLEVDEPVLLENPCLPEVLGVARAQGQLPVPMPVSEGGADIRLVDSVGRAARFAIVTPSHQYPSGTAMNQPQRKALLGWAESQGGYILEDDYDGEFWLSDNRLSTLFSQTTSDRVIYFNSFSKTLFPSLRISYLVLPKILVEPITAMKSTFEPQVSTMAELALKEFISSGAYTAHLRDMRQIYRERHNILRYALEQHLGNRIHIAPRQYGLHLCVDLNPCLKDYEIANEMKARGYGCKALSSYYFAHTESGRNGLVMGYAGWDAAELIRGVEILRTLCR